jgi:hypothetical protein
VPRSGPVTPANCQRWRRCPAQHCAFTVAVCAPALRRQAGRRPCGHRPVADAARIAGLYADRFEIEMTFRELKQHFGLGSTRRACRRPCCAMFICPAWPAF